MKIRKEKLDEMFVHYIDRKKYNQRCIPGTQDSLYSAGECAECEKWLKFFGVDISYETIQPMIDGRTEIRMRLEV